MIPCFQITIDVEGDNIWSRPSIVTTRNAEYLPRFQLLCEQYGLKPTYLVNWEMANSVAFREFGADIIKRSTGEIGMHLHAWNSPPIVPLTVDDAKQHPYLIEYPELIMREKIGVMTKTLEDTFGTKMVSHRAGRWAFSNAYARILVDHGYKVDCSVTPHISWRRTMGALGGAGGTDYTNYPSHTYWIHLGEAKLLEVPVTIVPRMQPILKRGMRLLCGKPLLRKLWLRPNGRNLADMVYILNRAIQEGRDYVQFVLHSSELMPGGSPTFDTKGKVETLYVDLRHLFSRVAQQCVGRTLSEYAEEYGLVDSAC